MIEPWATIPNNSSNAVTVATAMADGALSPSVIVAQLERALAGADPALVVVFASPEHPLQRVVERCVRRWPRATVLGASSAGEFTERRAAKGSVCAFALAGDFRVFAGIADGLAADVEGAVRRATDPLPGECAGFAHRTALILIDPLSGNVEEATLLCAAMLGDGVRLAGGAAADDLRMKHTSVALNGDVRSDAIVVAELFSRTPVAFGVCHGHQSITEPFEVTEVEANVVKRIEGRAAWDVWKERTAERARAAGIDPESLDGDALGAYLLRFEGALAAGRELKVRAPLSVTPEGGLAFACGIPRGAALSITDGGERAQIESAREAARRARVALGPHEVAGAIVFDCICRNLILRERFIDGVRAVSDELGGAPIAGFETYGEIAFDVGDMSGFHNTTTVVVAFGR
jgi:methyl-accepting chemotaxis protein